jgi:hypothetical protein
MLMYFRRDGGIRTHDLQHPMLARYRATLHPENFGYKYNKSNLMSKPGTSLYYNFL